MPHASPRPGLPRWIDAPGPVFAAAVLLAGLCTLRAILAKSGIIFAFPGDPSVAPRQDFMLYWAASKMILAGEALAAFDPVAFEAALPPAGKGTPYFYPPHLLFFVAPMALVSYGAAKAIWMGGAFASVAASARLASNAPLWPLVALSPGAYWLYMTGQSSAFAALLLTAGLLLAKERQILAGLCFALLTVKPQYGLLVPVFLAASGAWRAFAWAAAGGLFLAIASAIVFGVETWVVFATSPFDHQLAYSRLEHLGLVTVYQAAIKLGLAKPIAIALHASAITLGVIGVWRAARRWPHRAAVGFAILLSLFIAPMVWIYDWVLAAAGVLLLARDDGRWPVGLQAAAGFLWTAPLFVWTFQTAASSLVAPAALAATTWLYWRRREGSVRITTATASKDYGVSPSPLSGGGVS